MESSVYTVRDALMTLLGRCDHASSRDLQGFNRYDTEFAHDLGDKDSWTAKQEAAVYKMLRKYGGQLASHGIHWDELRHEFQDVVPDTTSDPWYRVVDSQYGPKLQFWFPYNRDLAEAIKRLPWESSHRRWTGSCWEVDFSRSNIRQLQLIGLVVPAEIAQLLETQTVVQLVLSGSKCKIRGELGHNVHQELSSIMSFRIQGCEFTPSYIDGTWDGYIRLYKRQYRRFPIGLLPLAIEVLAAADVPYEVIDTREVGEDIDMPWHGFKLRPYQKDAVAMALRHGSGVIQMPTGAGKTLAALKLIQMLKKSAVVLVHRKELLYQWRDRFRADLGIEPGLMGDGIAEEGQFTVAMMQTVSSKGLQNKYDILIADEVHHIPADTFQKNAERIGARYRYGLSATPVREDGKEMMIWAQVGPIISSVAFETLVDSGYLAKPKFFVVEHQGRWGGSTYAKEYNNCIGNMHRNTAIVEFAVAKYREGFKIYIDVRRIKHGELLNAMLLDAGIKSKFISGGTSTEERQDTLREFEADGFVLVSTLIKEGVDLPAMSMVLLAGAGKSSTAVIQTIGRALRPKAPINEAIIADVKDHGYYSKSHFRQRRDTMASYYGDLYRPEVWSC